MRAPEGDILRTHVAELIRKLVANDLDLVESRAIHACLAIMFENYTDGAKLAWRLRELLAREAAGQLRSAEQRHPAYKVGLIKNCGVQRLPSNGMLCQFPRFFVKLRCSHIRLNDQCTILDCV